MWLQAVQEALKPEVAAGILVRVGFYSVISATIAETMKRVFLSSLAKRILGEEYDVAPVTMKLLAVLIAATLAWISQPDGNILTFAIVAVMSSVGATFTHDMVKAHKPILPEDRPRPPEGNPED